MEPTDLADYAERIPKNDAKTGFLLFEIFCSHKVTRLLEEIDVYFDPTGECNYATGK